MKREEYTPERIKTAVEIINGLEWGQMPLEIFMALMAKIPSVPIDLAIIDSRGRVFLAHRDDQEFGRGVHFPGTVLRFGETSRDALARLTSEELAGIGALGPIYEVRHIEIPHGHGRGFNPTRQEMSIFHVVRLLGEIPSGKGIFVDVDNPPENLLPHHFLHFEKLREWLNEHPEF